MLRNLDPLSIRCSWSRCHSSHPDWPYSRWKETRNLGNVDTMCYLSSSMKLLPIPYNLNCMMMITKWLVALKWKLLTILPDMGNWGSEFSGYNFLNKLPRSFLSSKWKSGWEYMHRLPLWVGWTKLLMRLWRCWFWLQIFLWLFRWSMIWVS